MRRHTIIVAVLIVVACASAPGSAWAQTSPKSEYFVTSDGVRLHYLEAGSGPSLVFVPGWTMPAEIWAHQIDHFATTSRVIAFDPRGHGRSEKPAEGYHPTRLAKDIDELLAHLKGGPAVLVGWSLGVQEVVVCTHEFGTAQVRAVVLVDYPIDKDWATLKSRFVDLQVDRPAWTRMFVEAIHRSPQSEEYYEAMTRAALSTPTNAAAVMIANLILMGPSDLRPALDALDRPLLYVVREGRDDQVEIVRSCRPDARIEVLENVGHALFVDAPARFNQVLERFLATLPE